MIISFIFMTSMFDSEVIFVSSPTFWRNACLATLIMKACSQISWLDIRVPPPPSPSPIPSALVAFFAPFRPMPSHGSCLCRLNERNEKICVSSAQACRSDNHFDFKKTLKFTNTGITNYQFRLVF